MKKNDFEKLRFYQEELLRAKNKLFKAKSVKQLKLFQSRINFFSSKIEEIENRGKRN